MIRAAGWIEQASERVLLGSALGLVVLIGLADWLTGPEIAASIFYLIPVAVVAWRGWRATAAGLSLLSAATWLAADVGAGQFYSHPAIPYWNASVRLGFFITVAITLVSLREALDRERALARTDPLTGLHNMRSFLELSTVASERARRHRDAYSILFIDINGFKAINDGSGHAAGDAVLIEVAHKLKQRLRRTDLLARAGGDEFVVLLERTTASAAERLADELRTHVTASAADQRVSLSIGVAESTTADGDVEAVLRAADQAMYRSKAALRHGR